MSNEPHKNESWKSKSLEELIKSIPKPTLRMRFNRFFRKIKLRRDKYRAKIYGYRGHVASSCHKERGFKETYHVDTPPQKPSYDEMVRREIAIHQYIKDTDGIPNDLQQGR